jgi:3-(3-hydroxy-phenyl)propionate hydroxylase
MTIAAQPMRRSGYRWWWSVGLVSALNLALHEVPVLVQAHSELFGSSRRVFSSPTLEVLDPISVTAKRHDIGIVVPAWQLRYRTDGVVGLFDLSSLLKDETPFPYRLHVEQHKLTPLVYEMLMRMPHVDVRFSSRVTEVSQDANDVTVKAETPDGIDTFSGAWVIGADGGGSIVRKSAGIRFEGFTYPEKFALISTPYDLGKHGFTDTAYISHPVGVAMILADLGPPGCGGSCMVAVPMKATKKRWATIASRRAYRRKSPEGTLRHPPPHHLSRASASRRDIPQWPDATAGDRPPQ